MDKYLKSFTLGCFFISVLLAIIATIKCQSIELQGNIQSASETGCEHGLIAEEDMVIIEAIADFTGASSYWGRNVEFQLTSDVNFTFIADLYNCMYKNPDEGCYCQNKSNDVYQVTCRLKAKTEYSNAKLTAKLSSFNRKSKVSETQLPKMYDLESANFIVNDNFINKNSTKCEFHMDPAQPAIRACCYNAPSPCYVYVYTNGISLGEGERCFQKAVQFTDQYSIEFRICNKYLDVICKPKKPVETRNSGTMACFLLSAVIFPLSLYLF